jgi:hypothetical protein
VSEEPTRIHTVCPRCGYKDSFLPGDLAGTCECRVCLSQLDWREIPGAGPDCRPLRPGQDGEAPPAGPLRPSVEPLPPPQRPETPEDESEES